MATSHLVDVVLDSWHLRAICHTFLPLSITLSFEEGGKGKVPYESSFVCPQCANF